MEPSPSPFARLTPSNTMAKVAFDAAFDPDSNTRTSRQHIYVEPQQRYDKDVLMFRIQEEKKKRGDAEDSDSPTDVNTDTEKDLKHHGMIWFGWFTFDFDTPPSKSSTGWAVGKGRRGYNIDFTITTQQFSASVRGYHARFNFHATTGYIYISKVSREPSAEVLVNGKNMRSGEQVCLNKNPTDIRLGNLEYKFQYTDFAYTERFYETRQQYMTRYLNVSNPPNPSLTPTPSTTFRTFGNWTISNSLGKGTYGKVFSATNSKGEVVAIKVVDRSQRTIQQVNSEIQVLKELQGLSEANEGDRNRVVRLNETIYQHGTETYTSAGFEEVALVLEPAVTGTFLQITNLAANQR